MNKYAPLILKRIAKVIVGDGSPNKLTGKDLVDFFNAFGFNDDYVYPNVGITTQDLGSNLSRTDYTRKRLGNLNEKHQMDAALSMYIESSADKKFAENAIMEIIGNVPDVKVTQSVNNQTFIPKSQFDDIKEGIPTVFISYSWDDDEHKAWAKQLADDLRGKYGICSLIDKYNPAGADIVEFMNRGIRVANRVLAIGTPLYKEKSENGVGSGGKYEGVLITTEIYNNTDTFKFIPLLRRGKDFKSSFITVLASRNGYDFRDDTQYEGKLKDLADEIYGRKPQAPALAENVIDKPNENQVVIPSEYKGERWLYELLKYFSFFLMDDYFDRMPCRFDIRVITMFDSWNGIISSSVYHINDAQLRQKIDNFYFGWKEICEFGAMYFSDSNNGTDYVFYGAEFDMFKDREHEEAFEKIKDLVIALYSVYKDFVGYLDTNYPQIDREKVSVDFVNLLKKGVSYL